MHTTLQDLMCTPLPSISEQKKLPFRPSKKLANHVHRLVNEEIFEDRLYRPKIDIAARRRLYWGLCIGYEYTLATKSYCEIRLMDKFFCVQWFVSILAHEMVHQYQWDIYSAKREKRGLESLMSHGPSFHQFRDRFEKHHIPLKTVLSVKSWFESQDILKC